MKVIILAVLIIVSTQLPAYACKCVKPCPEIEEAYKKADAVFLGRCVKAEFIVQTDVNIEGGYVVRYTFSIQRL